MCMGFGFRVEAARWARVAFFRRLLRSHRRNEVGVQIGHDQVGKAEGDVTGLANLAGVEVNTGLGLELQAGDVGRMKAHHFAVGMLDDHHYGRHPAAGSQPNLLLKRGNHT